MDSSKIVFLVNDHVSAVRAVYEDDNSAKKYVFKCFDQSIKIGDLAVVQTGTRFGFTVVKILETNIDVDFDSPIEFKWLVQKVDLDGFNGILAQEGQAIAAVQSAELRRKKAELRRTMFADAAENIAALPLAGIGDSTTVYETPPSPIKNEL